MIIDYKWKNIYLSDVLYEHGERNSKNLEIYSVSVHKGLVNQIEHLGRSYAAKDTSNYKLVKPYDIVYTKSPTGDFPYGIVKQSKVNKEVAVSPLYGVFTPKNKYLGALIDNYFEFSENANRYLKPIIQKGAKNTINISNDTFLSQSIPLPMDEYEQKKWYELIELFNNCIDLIERDIDASLELKKAICFRFLYKGGA
jgi:type I restriction enzyme S subunit